MCKSQCIEWRSGRMTRIRIAKTLECHSIDRLSERHEDKGPLVLKVLTPTFVWFNIVLTGEPYLRSGLLGTSCCLSIDDVSHGPSPR
jgi:hypothetical protein